MSFSFSSNTDIKVAKYGVLVDGDNVTVGSDGYTVSSTLYAATVLKSNPVRSATGVWSVQLKEVAVVVMGVVVETVLASGHYLSTQLLPVTKTTEGKAILNWVFHVSGTPTDLPSGGSFRITVVYADRTI